MTRAFSLVRGQWFVDPKNAWTLAFLVASPVLVVLMHLPTWASLTTTLPGNLGDPTLATWILAWEWHALTTDPTLLFEGNIFYPFGEAVKYSDSMLPLVPIFGIVLSLSGNVLLAHHVVLLCLSLLCLISTYFLAKRLTDHMTAVIAAVAFTFSGFVFMHQTHMPLLAVGFFPLGFLFAFRLFERRRIVDGVVLGVVSILLATSSLYYAAIWLPCLALLLVLDLRRSWPPPRSWITSVAAAFGALAVGLGPLAYVYAEFQGRVAWQRDLSANVLGAVDFITPAPKSLIYNALFEWANGRSTTGTVEHGFFIGFIAMALVVVGLITLLRKGPRHAAASRRSAYELVLLTSAGIVSLVIALGPRLGPIPMPFLFLQDHVVGFDNVRAVSRLAVPFLLSAAVLAAWGLRSTLTKATPARQGLLVLLVTAGILVELFVEPIRAPVDEPPAIRETLSSAEPGAVIELPMREVPDSEYVYTEGPRLLESIGDWRPRWNGFSGGFPPGYVESIPILMQFPQSDALNLLSSFGLRYVLLHGAADASRSTYSFAQIQEIVGSLPRTASVLRVGNDWLVDLHP